VIFAQKKKINVILPVNSGVELVRIDGIIFWGRDNYMRLQISAFVFIFLMTFSLFADESSKYALVVGNSNYQHTAVLKNPSNDARDMADVLTRLGFDVQLVVDANKAQLEAATNSFTRKLMTSKGVGLFFYAGHGSQLEGENYLIPVDVQLNSEYELRDKGYSISYLLRQLERTRNQTNIIILDACRDNPFGNSFQSASRSLAEDGRGIKVEQRRISAGLSKLQAPSNTLIAFATAPGKVAADGEKRNSPYTKQLIKNMQQEGYSVEKVFKEVRSEVLEITGGKQIPWESSSLVTEFYFKPRRSIPVGW
jgi:uncharacterized caspase-like protein